MDNNLLEKTRQAVEKYHSKQAGDKVKATRTILSAVLDCRNFIAEAEREDQGGTQQLARQLSEVLSALPMFANFAADKTALNSIDTKQLADEHLDMIQRDLENSVKEMQVGKKKKIQDWVKSHPVLGKLKKSATKDLPQGAYVLLFRRSANLPPKRKGGGRRDFVAQGNNESAIAALTILEQPVLEQRLEQPVSEQPVLEQRLEQPVSEQPVSDQPESEQPVSEQPVSEQPVSEQPVSEPLVSEQPVSEQLVSEQLVSEQLVSEQPDSEQPDSKPPALEQATEEISPELASESDELAETEAEGQSAQNLEEQLEESGSHDEQSEFPAASGELSESNEDDDHDLEISDDEEQHSESAEEASVSESDESLTHLPQERSEEPEHANTNTATKVAEKQVVEKIPPDLVVRPAPDGKVFTRFRPKEFSDDTRVYRMFRGGPPLVGACIIADGKLLASIGVLPQPEEGRDQLRLLLSISKDAVGKPGRDFVESNPVLNELFNLCKSRSIHKDAYILLFQTAEEKSEAAPAEVSSSVTGKGSSGVIMFGENPVSDEATMPEENAGETSSGEEFAEQGHDEEIGIASKERHGGTAETGNGSDHMEVQEAASTNEAAQAPKLELVSKTTEDGRIITRYRSFDFSDMRALYETFKKRPPVVGAAIIRERDLIKVIGTVPAADGTKHIDVLLGVSRQALEKPAMEFISANPILNSIYELSNGDYRHKEYDVVLFTETDGRPEILSLSDKRGRLQTKTPLSEFRIPKSLHERFKAERPVVGASIIGEQVVAAPAHRESTSKAGKDKGGSGSKPESSFRPRNLPARSSIVLAAFGRTPLKQNVLLSVEILKRLGVDLSIL